MGSPSRDFILDLAMGKIPGHTMEFVAAEKEGQNIIDGVVTMWDHTGVWNRLTVGTELFASSTSTSDVAGTFVVCSGLDGDFEPKFTLTELNGQNQVSVGADWLYVKDASIAFTGAVGDVYVAESDTLTAGVPDTATKVQAKIIAGNNFSHNGFFIVPANCVAAVAAVRGSTDASGKPATISTFINPLGQPLLRTTRYSFEAGLQEFQFRAPVLSRASQGQLTIILDEKTTSEFRSAVASNSTNVFFGVDYYIMPKSEIGVP